MISVQQAIDILVKAGWIYEGSTKINSTRAYIMRQYIKGLHVTQHVIYFTTHGLRREALKEKAQA